MRSYINIFTFIVLAGLVSAGFAQEAVTSSNDESSVTPGGSNEAVVPSFPYVAEITGDNMYVRSGPGTNFYHCGKLNTGDKVKVVGKQFSWSRIIPPAGSFSWISMQYVRIDTADPSVGILTGDSVRVYAGSDFVKPLYSTTLQGKLNRGEKVKLLGEQMDDYYKILSPPFAYLWVSTQFTKPVKVEPVVEVTPTVEPTTVESPTEPNDANAVVLVVDSPESKLEKYRELKKQVETERAKPIDQQDYTSMKKALLEIAGDKEAGNAARYAKFVIGQIESCELALAVIKEVRLQNEQLQKINTGIDKARATKLAEVKDLGKYAAVGQLRTFVTYGPGHFRIVDESGNMICYALPAGQAAKLDFTTLIGRKVGIVGTIEPHLPTKKALVRFSEIVEIK